MLVVLSPAKTLTIDAVSTRAAKATPRFAKEADALVSTLSNLSPPALSKMMGISSSLAQLNHERFKSWNGEANPRAAAALAFDGPAFKALNAREMKPEALAKADETVRCLSGLYGLLKPTDAIQPYRLCMGTKLDLPIGKDLYTFWGERVAAALDADLDEKVKKAKAPSRVVVNAASEEYWKVVKGKLRPETRVVAVSFPGAPAVYAKQARGAVARFIAERQLDDPKGLAEFVGGGCEGTWSYDASSSSEDNYVFTRRAGKAAPAATTAVKKEKTAAPAPARRATGKRAAVVVKAEPAPSTAAKKARASRK